ncbi:MAG: membrane dipeptidase [candidate division WOR-3 bacterium]
MEKIIFDLHQDLLEPLLRGVNFEKNFFKFNVISVFTPFIWKDKKFIETLDIYKALRTIETYREFAEKSGLIIIEKKEDLKRVLNSDKKGFILEIEGCSFILDKYILKAFINLGVRIFTLTWNFSNHIASSCAEKNDFGLTDSGRKIVEEIVSNKCIIDLAHAGRKTFYDVYKLKIPFIVSHTGILNKPKSKRNISFEEMKRIKKRKGIVGIGLGNIFFERKINKNEVLKEIRKLIKKYPENIALGSDLFGLSEKHIIEGLYSYKEIEEAFKEFPENFLYLNAYKFFEENLT